MPRSFIDRLLLPAIFGLTTMLAVLILWQMLLGHRNVEIQSATRDQVSFIRTKAESALTARTLFLERLAAHWKTDRRLTQDDMQADAALVTSGFPAYRSIEWVSPSFRPLWSVPTAEESAPGRDLSAVTALRAALKGTSAAGTVVAPRVVLPSGALGFLVCVPVRSARLNGFLVGVFQDNELLSSILQGVAQDYWVAVYDGTTPIYERGNYAPPRDNRYAEQATISVQGLSWRAVAWPKAGAVSYARSALPVLVSIGGI